MQPEFLIASAGIAALFGLGFLAGYLVRAMVSRGRRRRAMPAGWPGTVPVQAVSTGRSTEMPTQLLPADSRSPALRTDATIPMSPAK